MIGYEAVILEPTSLRRSRAHQFLWIVRTFPACDFLGDAFNIFKETHRDGPRTLVLLTPGIAADDRQYLASNVAGTRRCGEKHVRRCNLFGLCRSLHGCFAAELRNSPRRLVSWIERRPHRTRRHGIDANTAIHQMRR